MYVTTQSNYFKMCPSRKKIDWYYISSLFTFKSYFKIKLGKKLKLNINILLLGDIHKVLWGKIIMSTLYLQLIE